MIRHRFTVEEYHKAFQAGALPERVELLEGEVYEGSPMGKMHIRYLIHLTNALATAFEDKALVVSQVPLLIPPDSEPEPDLMLLRSPASSYDHRPPQKEDALVVVEISETTLVQDRTLKLPLYRGTEGGWCGRGYNAPHLLGVWPERPKQQCGDTWTPSTGPAEGV